MLRKCKDEKSSEKMLQTISDLKHFSLFCKES
jgi:hypothetical protein